MSNIEFNIHWFR